MGLSDLNIPDISMLIDAFIFGVIILLIGSLLTSVIPVTRPTGEDTPLYKKYSYEIILFLSGASAYLVTQIAT